MLTTFVPAARLDPAPGSVTTAVRTDIQALRALAVTLVLVYHLWPNGLTGGFIGVDVFFVISGFLITTHLLHRPPRAMGDVTRFWARRIRRLLPASLLVLATTLVASRIVAPETQWLNTARQAAAAALYVVNWVLAADSVDYLASDNLPTPVQHFWSLSVEEQFYFVWPIVVGVLAWLAVRRGQAKLVVVGLGALAACSLIYSVVATNLDPASAYFVTPTRAWEFAMGGVLAALARPPVASMTGEKPRFRLTNRGRSALAIAGLLAIVAAALFYSETTPFPGWLALIPTLGAAVVMAAMPEVGTGRLGSLLALRPVQWMGDVSYSVYLWHWPLIVLVPYVSGGELGLLDKSVIIVLTLVLAAGTKQFVEDRFRRPVKGSLRPTFLAAALGMAVVVGLAGLQVLEVRAGQNRAQTALEQAKTSTDPCFGAGALLNREQCADRPPPQTLVPTPVQAADDKSEAYPEVSGGKDCWSSIPDFPTVTCTFGDPDASRRVALVGNSHAGQWLPALQRIAETEGWQITTYLASRCAFSDLDQNLPTPQHTAACRDWVRTVTDEIAAEDFELVVLTNRMSVTASGAATLEESADLYQRGYERVLETWSKKRVPLLVLQDTPAPGDAGIESIPDCVAANLSDFTRCSAPRDDWIPTEPMVPAFAAVEPRGARLADLNDYICGPEICSPVVGGVITYSDGSHLTATYARTLAPPLADEMAKVGS